ncbi:MAG: dual specificity protein phosphatase family protein [Elusimicrobia bacterium]|nr:dual specificity protein phosphatase family protein [Elusimicrobiota bacterium]
MKDARKAVLAALAAGLLAAPAGALDSAAVLKSAVASAGALLPSAAAVPPPPAPVAAVAVAPAAAPSAKSWGPKGPLDNFHQVDSGFYRSAQPTQQGVDMLAQKGIKTILKLNDNDPAEQDWADADGIKLVNLLMSNRVSPTYQQIDQALAIIEDPANQPVDIHCHLGHDRTGAVAAAYRVTVQGWSVDQAAQEAHADGYSAPGFTDITDFLNGYLSYRAGK